MNRPWRARLTGPPGEDAREPLLSEGGQAGRLHLILSGLRAIIRALELERQAH